MATFSGLLRDTRWAWLFTVATALIVLAVAIGIYLFESKTMIPHRIAFFESFFNETKKENEFPQMVRTLLGEGAVSQRLAALRAFSGKKMDNDRGLLLGLDHNMAVVLVQHKKAIPALIQKEKERLEKLRINWLIGSHHRWVFGFHPVILVWQIVSVVSLLVYWVKYSYAMSYFPYRKWWLWVFCILTFPWSSILGIAFMISFIANGISKLTVHSRRRSSREPSYEEFCISLQQNLFSLRAQWEKLFPITILQEKTRELGEKVAALREKLTKLGSDMETIEREHATGVATLERLNAQSASHSGRDEDLWRKEWMEELERILANPNVRGARIVPHDNSSWWFEIYTGTFATLWGNLGPMKISVNSEYDSFWAELAHGAAVMDAIGQSGATYFCFGEVEYTIRGLIKEHKINDALGVMIASFEAGVTVDAGL